MSTVLDGANYIQVETVGAPTSVVVKDVDGDLAVILRDDVRGQYKCLVVPAAARPMLAAALKGVTI